MARRKSPERLSEIAAAAVEVFIRAGYSGAQMDDVAALVGVAKGTLYLYVESKEALFDLAVRAQGIQTAHRSIRNRLLFLTDGTKCRCTRRFRVRRKRNFAWAHSA